MDAHNLATLFGPNLLHKAKGCEYEVETPERAEERKDVIAVIQDMITSFDVFFQVRHFIGFQLWVKVAHGKHMYIWTGSWKVT